MRYGRITQHDIYMYSSVGLSAMSQFRRRNSEFRCSRRKAIYLLLMQNARNTQISQHRCLVLLSDYAKTRFWPFVCYLTYTRKKLFYAKLPGYFRSRDKDGGNIIRSAIAQNPMLHTNFTRLYSTNQKLLSIQLVSDFEFLRCPNFAGAVGEKLYICC